MEIKNIFIVAIAVMLLPILPRMAQAEQRNVHIAWEYQYSEFISGYRIYHEDTLLCQIDDPTATSADCTLEAPDGETWFTITSFIQDGPESLPSSSLSYVFASELVARISADTLTGQAPLLLNFDASSSTGDIAAYSWDFGDGEIAAGSTTEHTFISAGTYTATLLVTDSQGASHQDEITIAVTDPTTVANNPPTAAISSSSAIGDAPLQVIFDAATSTDSDGTIISYSWEMGDGGLASGVSVTYTYTTPGTYRPTLTVTDDGGLTDTTDTPVLVQSPPTTNIAPTAVIKASGNRGKLPLKVSFNGGESNDEDGEIVSYKWNFGDGSTASGQQVKHTFFHAGEYTVSLTVTDNAGANSQPATMVLNTSGSTALPGPPKINILPIINYLLISNSAENDNAQE